jgi:hypothetical protein
LAELATVPKAWHVYARNKFVKQKKHFPKERRPADRTPATLFSGTLICGYCGNALYLSRSAGPYKTMSCLKGRDGIHSCELATAKSVRIIEQTLLDYVFDQLLTENRLRQLVRTCNDKLLEESRRPKADVKPLKRREKDLQRQVSKLMGRISGCDDSFLCDAYDGEIAVLQRQLSQVRQELGDSQKANSPLPPPLDEKKVLTHLNDIRSLLNQEVPAANHALRTLTGPIVITQEKYPNKKNGAVWHAKFTPNLLGLLARINGNRDCPDSVTMGLLCTRNWIMTETVTVAINRAPAKLPAYIEFSATVAELRDIKAMTWDSIVGHLTETYGIQLSVTTLGRAYAYAVSDR